MVYSVISTLSKWAVPLLLLIIPLIAQIRGIKVFETFVEGAEKGFETAIKTIPYLVAMMVAIGVFRASGAMDLFISAIKPLTSLVGAPPEILPLGIMRPLSGGGALGITAELIKTHGPDSFVGRLASTLQGSTDTTFFVLTLYFGSVGVSKYRYSVIAGLTADITGFLASIFICTRIFGG